MSDSFYQDALRQLNSLNVGEIAGHLNEKADSVSQAVTQGTATIVKSLAEKFKSAPDAGSSISALVSKVSGLNLSNNVTDLLGANGGLKAVGGELLSSLFGSKLDSVFSTLSKNTGLSSAGATSILTLISSGILKTIGSKVAAGQSIGSLFSGNNLNYQSNAIGSDDCFTTKTTTKSVNPVLRQDVIGERKKHSKFPWWLLLLLGLILLGLYWFFSHEKADKKALIKRTPVETVISKPAIIETPALPALPANSMESRLLAFIKDPTQPVQTSPWFELDHVMFDTASADVEGRAQTQLANVAAILKAYPNIKLNVGGYTDNVGSTADNQALSENRAKDVKGYLVGLGIAGNRLESIGYGESNPVSTNDTAAGRQDNRRVSLLVTAK